MILDRAHLAIGAVAAVAVLALGIDVGHRWGASTAAQAAADRQKVERAITAAGGNVATTERHPVAPLAVRPRTDAIRRDSGARVTASGEGSTGAVKVSAPAIERDGTWGGGLPDGKGVGPISSAPDGPADCCLLCTDSLNIHVSGARVEGSGATGLVADAWATRASDGAELMRGPLHVDYRVVPPPRRTLWAATMAYGWQVDRATWAAGVERRLWGPAWAGVEAGPGRAVVRVRVEF